MRPYQLLPLPMPRDFDPGVDDPAYFYRNFVKPFIPDMVQMMNTGLLIDSKAVEKLRTTVYEVLDNVEKQFTESSLIEKFQILRLPKAQKEHAEKCTKSIRVVEHYIKDFNEKDILHRTWVVNTYIKKIGKNQDTKDKWTIRSLKLYNRFLDHEFIADICNKVIESTDADVMRGMLELAQYKLTLWNRPRYEKAEKPVTLPPFNSGSSKQVKEFFEMLKIPPLAFSKDTGEASWGRDQLEIVYHESTDKNIRFVLKAMIDFSSSSIIKTNFLKAFDKYTIDGVLHGNIKLFGAKSFRNTSNSPNLLNAPSTGSVYAKPLKKCFIARKGYIIFTADLAALEDRGIANLSGDTNKCNIFLEGLDGHSLNACGYFPELIEVILGPNTDNIPYVRRFKAGVDDGSVALDKIRFLSKAPTFKLAYGGYPDAHKGGVITQEIFDNYHNVLYPGITKYRENYVLPTARANGYIHLGLGCRLYCTNASEQIRTLNNATVQFWSILTLIAINEFNYLVKEAGYELHMRVISTIYDSIYVEVKAEPKYIEFVNNLLIKLMCVKYLENEIIPNEAQGEIGLNWAELHKITNNASLDEIQSVLDIL